MGLTRRQFLTLMGGSAGAAVLFQACGVPEDELLIDAPIEMPEDLVTGLDNWYATTLPGGFPEVGGLYWASNQPNLLRHTQDIVSCHTGLEQFLAASMNHAVDGVARSLRIMAAHSYD